MVWIGVAELSLGIAAIFEATDQLTEVRVESNDVFSLQTYCFVLPYGVERFPYIKQTDYCCSLVVNFEQKMGFN